MAAVGTAAAAGVALVGAAVLTALVSGLVVYLLLLALAALADRRAEYDRTEDISPSGAGDDPCREK